MTIKNGRMTVLIAATFLAGHAHASPVEAVGKFFGKLFKGSAAYKESAEAGRAAKAADGVTGSDSLTALDVYVVAPAAIKAASQAASSAAKLFRDERCSSDECQRTTDLRTTCRASDGRILNNVNQFPLSRLPSNNTEFETLRGEKQLSLARLPPCR